MSLGDSLGAPSPQRNSEPLTTLLALLDFKLTAKGMRGIREIRYSVPAFPDVVWFYEC